MKKIISIILCAVLLICSLMSFAFAEEKLSYVVLGDSIAFGSGLVNPTQSVYGKIVADTNGYDYKNYAVPGHTTGNLLNVLKNESVRDSLSSADIISISIGGNNFLTDNIYGLLFDAIAKKDYHRFDEIAERFYADFSLIIDTIRTLNADAAILVQTVYNPQRGYTGEAYGAATGRINDKINLYSAEHPGDIIVVDVASKLTSSGDFAEDGIHPSASGNQKIAALILEVLRENGLGANTEPVINTRGLNVRGTFFMTLFMRLFGNLFHVIALLTGHAG